MEESIFCPKCADAKMKKVNISGVVVDKCPRCQGIWFDMLEKDDLKKIRGSEMIDTAKEPADLDHRMQKIDCPKCHTLMSPTRDLHVSRVVYEKCSVCYGIFLDAGEFSALRSSSIWNRIKGMLGFGA